MREKHLLLYGDGTKWFKRCIQVAVLSDILHGGVGVFTLHGHPQTGATGAEKHWDHFLPWKQVS